MFKAWLLENPDGFKAKVTQVNESHLPSGDVTLAVAYSTLNCKDGWRLPTRALRCAIGPWWPALMVLAPLHKRQRAWHRLARDLDPTLLESMVQEVPLEQAIDKAQALMDGLVRGRIVVNLKADHAA